MNTYLAIMVTILILTQIVRITQIVDYFERHKDPLIEITAQQSHATIDGIIQENMPLTLEELRQIYDEEDSPIWVRFENAYWPAILDMIDDELVAVWCAKGNYLREIEYGKIWLAYRHRPKEDASQ